jgi:hypothetical protein
MSDFTFPFDSCEKPQETIEIGGIKIAQPWSVAANMVSIFVILFFLFKTKKVYTFLLIFMFLLFESFHTFSHAIHLEGKMQYLIVHILATLINVCYLYAFYKSTKVFPSKLFIAFIAAVEIADIYAFNYFSFLYTFITQLVIFVSIFLYYKPHLPAKYQGNIPYILSIVFLIILVLANERYNCDKMLAVFPDFPFHIMIECLGTLAFYLILSNVYLL